MLGDRVEQRIFIKLKKNCWYMRCMLFIELFKDWMGGLQRYQRVSAFDILDP